MMQAKSENEEWRLLYRVGGAAALIAVTFFGATSARNCIYPEASCSFWLSASNIALVVGLGMGSLRSIVIVQEFPDDSGEFRGLLFKCHVTGVFDHGKLGIGQCVNIEPRSSLAL